MLKPKAIEIIKTFSAGELKEFGLFIGSAYFNTNKNLVRLYRVISKNHKDLDSEKITEEYLYTKIFPAKKYNYGIMKNLMSDLSKLSEKFLIINRNNKEIEGTRQKLLLLNEYDLRGLDIYFKNMSGKLEKYLESSRIDDQHYQDRFKANSAVADFYQGRSDMKNYYNSVFKKGELALSYIISILSDEVVIKFNLEHAANKKPDVDFVNIFIENINIEYLIHILEKNDIADKKDVIIKLKTILLLNKDDQDEIYYSVKDEICNNPGLYTNNMLQTFFNNTLLTYTEKRASQDSDEFFTEKYNLMKKMFSMVKFNSEGVGYIFHSVYFDFILSAIKHGELDYAEGFARDFVKHIDPFMQDVADHLGKAYIYAAKEDYETCLAELAVTSQADFHIKLRTKFLYLKCYFELNAYEQGLSMVDSFKKFIAETKEIHPDFRSKLIDSCKSYNQLYKISASPEGYTAEKLDKQIEFIKKSNILSKQWHLDKMEEFRNTLVNKK
jgi:hypothetical protein